MSGSWCVVKPFTKHWNSISCHIQVDSLPLDFLCTASSRRHFTLNHSPQHFHPFYWNSSISVFSDSKIFIHQPSTLSRLQLLVSFVAVSTYALLALAMSLLHPKSMCTTPCLSSFVPQKGWFLSDLKFSQNTSFKPEAMPCKQWLQTTAFLIVCWTFVRAWSVEEGMDASSTVSIKAHSWTADIME